MTTLAEVRASARRLLELQASAWEVNQADARRRCSEAIAAAERAARLERLDELVVRCPWCGGWRLAVAFAAPHVCTTCEARGPGHVRCHKTRGHGPHHHAGGRRTWTTSS